MQIEDQEQEINLTKEDITVIASLVNDVLVNGVSVVDNRVAYVDVPTKVSELENDSKFITNTVNNLFNYYTKLQTYTKEEVNRLIGSSQGSKFEIVDTLPITGETNTVYLVPSDDPSIGNAYNEYIYVNGSWELIGSTGVDLSDYVKDVQINGTSIKSSGVANIPTANNSTFGVVKTSGSYGVKQTDGILQIQNASTSNISDKISTFFPITPSTLDYAVKVGVTTNTNTLTTSEKTNAQTWLGFVTCTQAEYDALVQAGTVDNGTYYHIIEE